MTKQQIIEQFVNNLPYSIEAHLICSSCENDKFICRSCLKSYLRPALDSYATEVLREVMPSLDIKSKAKDIGIIL